MSTISDVWLLERPAVGSDHTRRPLADPRPASTDGGCICGYLAGCLAADGHHLLPTPTVDGFCTKTATRYTAYASSTTRARLYVELSGEDGTGPWTVLAVDRESRRYAAAQRNQDSRHPGSRCRPNGAS